MVREAKTRGSVVGTVWLVGGYERPARLKVFKNRDFCGPSVANESLLVNSDGGVQNTVIVLQPTDRQARVQPASIVLDNRNCAFLLLLMSKWRRWAASCASRTAIRFFTLCTPVWATRRCST